MAANWHRLRQFPPLGKHLLLAELCCCGTERCEGVDRRQFSPAGLCALQSGGFLQAMVAKLNCARRDWHSVLFHLHLWSSWGQELLHLGEEWEWSDKDLIARPKTCPQLSWHSHYCRLIPHHSLQPRERNFLVQTTGHVCSLISRNWGRERDTQGMDSFYRAA